MDHGTERINKNPVSILLLGRGTKKDEHIHRDEKTTIHYIPLMSACFSDYCTRGATAWIAVTKASPLMSILPEFRNCIITVVDKKSQLFLIQCRPVHVTALLK